MYKPKVVVSCAERFHSYDLAAQLNKHEILDKLITTYPKSEVIKYGVPYNRIQSLLYWEIIKRGWTKISGWSGLNINIGNTWLNQHYDTIAAIQLNQGLDCFIGWSARSEKQIAKAKALGAITILERGSSHALTQIELLEEEYSQYAKKKGTVITARPIIEKELREYEMADYISIPSSFVKRTFVARGFSESKLLQNPYGVNLTKFTPGIKNDDVFRVLYVGQMSLRKGVHYLLEAFAALKLPKAELLLVGSMTDEITPFFKKFPDQVRYVGSQPQDQLKYFYQQSSVFAICSIEEGMAMVQAQAMACGLPLICTTNTGGEDLIRDNKEGFVIPIRNVDALREKIEWCFLNQEEVKEMGVAARIRVMQGFTWKDYGSRYVENIHIALKHRGSFFW